MRVKRGNNKNNNNGLIHLRITSWSSLVVIIVLNIIIIFMRQTFLKNKLTDVWLASDLSSVLVNMQSCLTT